MEEASDNLNFEQAGEYKQTIQSINATTEDQKIMMKDKVDRDVLLSQLEKDMFACCFSFTEKEYYSERIFISMKLQRI